MFLTTAEVALAAPAIAVAGTLLGGWVQSRRDRETRLRELERERLRWRREDDLELQRQAREDALEKEHRDERFKRHGLKSG